MTRAVYGHLAAAMSADMGSPGSELPFLIFPFLVMGAVGALAVGRFLALGPLTGRR